MPSLATLLKGEIQRLARKEAREQTKVMKKTSSQYRRDIAELKRQVRVLQKEVTFLKRQEKKRMGRPGAQDVAANGANVRFSPSWVELHRERLELSAADYGQLVGVSALTIYNWEKGKTRPRQQQLTAWGKIRGLGKREAWKRLEMMGV